MVKVDVLMTATLKSIIGPVQTIKRVINNHDYFLNNGYDISVFTNDNLGITIITKIKENESFVIKRLKEFARYLSLHTRLYSTYKIYSSFKGSRRLLSYYTGLDRNPEIIVFHSIFDCYEYLKHYRKEGVKIVLFTHSDGLIFKMLLSYYPKLQGGIVERKLMKIADYVMSNVTVKPCIAKIEETNLLAVYPQLDDKTCLVVNAIDDLTLEEKTTIENIRKTQIAPKYRFVCSGSINGRKGQRIIIEALHNLPKEVLKDIHVSFIGDGPEKISLEDIVVKYNLSDCVTFEGAVKNTDVYKYLAKANIFILMSRMEGLPIALIEALRNRLALVSTNVSGIPELIDENVNGKLLNPDVNELKTLFESLDQYDWEEMGKQSRKIFEEYYVFTRMRSDYINMLNKTIGK